VRSLSLLSSDAKAGPQIERERSAPDEGVGLPSGSTEGSGTATATGYIRSRQWGLPTRAPPPTTWELMARFRCQYAQTNKERNGFY